MVSVCCILISILSVSVEALEISCADTSGLELEPLQYDESLASNMRPQQSKLIL